MMQSSGTGAVRWFAISAVIGLAVEIGVSLARRVGRWLRAVLRAADRDGGPTGGGSMLPLGTVLVGVIGLSGEC